MPERISVSEADAIAQFQDWLKDEMRFVIDRPIIGDGSWHNVPRMDKPSEKQGGYRLFLNGNINGQARDNASGETTPLWYPSGERVEITPAQARAQAQEAQRQRQQAARERLDAMLAALKTAREILSKSEPASPNHPYLSRKHLDGEGFRQINAVGVMMNGRDLKDHLIIPRYIEVDGMGKLVGLQAISPDGTKMYQKDAPVKGSYRVWGDPRETGDIYIGTGAATSAAIYAATRVATYASFDDGNLLAVAQHVRKSFPQSRITITGDNDQWHYRPGAKEEFGLPDKATVPGNNMRWEMWRRLGHLNNPGAEKAAAAALEVKAALVLPSFPLNHPAKLTDFSDLLVERGPEAVRAHFIQAITPKISPGETEVRMGRRHGIRMGM